MTPTHVLACHVCGQPHRDDTLAPGTIARCVRCHTTIAIRPAGDSLHRTAALSLAALILYVPANLFPILRMSQYGTYSDNTILQSASALWKHGDFAIAIIVFLASVLIPLLKLLGLFYLCISVRRHHVSGKRWRTWTYHAIEAIGRWAMLDVFILGILVSLVKLRGLATVVPGPGLFAFGAVVVLTLIASASFDPRLIWEVNDERKEAKR